MQLRQDIGVGALFDVREESLTGRVGQGDRAVGRAHDEGLSHRPDDRIQLRRTSVLGLGQPLEANLDLDPLLDVAGDGGHDPS